MTFLTAILAAFLLLPSAQAAVIAATKEKKPPTIDNVRVENDMLRFGFDIVDVPGIGKYDVWAGIATARGKKVGDWFVSSFGIRRGKRAPTEAAFGMNLPDILRFAGEGKYTFTAYLCPANLKKPNGKGCSHATTLLEYAE